MRLSVLILLYISLPLPEGMETRQTFAVGENKPEIWIPLKKSVNDATYMDQSKC